MVVIARALRDGFLAANTHGFREHLIQDASNAIDSINGMSAYRW
jgi:hypothetical protein